MAKIEAQIYKFSEILSIQRSNTIENVQRKQALRPEEREEDDDDVANDEPSEDEEEEVIYNPKNLPLGWDGKVNIFYYSLNLFMSPIFD